MRDDLRAALVRFVLEGQREPLVVLDEDGRVVEANRSAHALEAYLGKLFERPSADARLSAFLEELRAFGEAYTLVASAAGRVHRLEGHAVDPFFVVVLRDVTDQRQVDDELRELRPRASLGLAAASIVHDFNNLLTPILMSSSRLVRELQEGSTASMARLIHTSATLAAALTRDLLALARPRTAMIERVIVNDAIREIQPLLERLVGDDIELVLALDDASGAAMLDRKRFEHALLNLVVNARDAMPDGGRVTITTRLVEHQRVARILFSVADTGVGMPHDVRQRAFESFFTTKADAGGMGLGLTSVQRFAHETGGDVSIDSEPMRGTTVTLVFDRLPVEAPSSAVSRSAPLAGSDGELILVADRAPHVREAIRIALEGEGYAVVLAESQETALDRAARHPVQVAVIDDRLTWRDPRGFLQRLRSLRPDVRLVFMSDAIAREWAPDAIVSVVSKAFTEEDLLRSVRRVLGATRPASEPEVRQ